jgi:hypothetical protein
MQITGAPQDEANVLGLAHAYERAAGAWQGPPLG